MTDIISEYGLLLRNAGKEYTYNCQLGKSVIDLTLTCSKALNFSDHNTISYTIAAKIIQLPPSRNWHKADWGIFEKELNGHDWEICENFTEKRINQWVERLTRQLTNALDKACPLSPPAPLTKKNMVHSPT